MKKYRTMWMIAALFFLSGVIYLVQFLEFHDARDTFFYMLQDWAFLPIQIAIVTIVAGRIMAQQEKENRLEKTRMLASSFFSEVGLGLMQRILPCVREGRDVIAAQHIQTGWRDADFTHATEAIRKAKISVDCSAEDLEGLKTLLIDRRMSLLVLTSNPALLEHENITDMFWAVFHLTDEVMMRGDFSLLSKADRMHLNEDVQRAIREILINWYCHMNHIRTEYPYLYSMELHQGGTI